MRYVETHVPDFAKAWESTCQNTLPPRGMSQGGYSPCDVSCGQRAVKNPGQLSAKEEISGRSIIPSATPHYPLIARSPPLFQQPPASALELVPRLDDASVSDYCGRIP